MFKITSLIPGLRWGCYIFLLVSLASCSGIKPGLKEHRRRAVFSSDQRSTIIAHDENTPMRIYLITHPEDSMLLRSSSQAIAPDPDNRVLNHFIKRLYSTVTDKKTLGVGIAAPQVGILKRIIWVQRFDKPDFPFEVYLNPKITQYSDKKQPCQEGCLSIPDIRDTTQNRSYAILLEYDTIEGLHKYEMVEDFTAVIFQHEIDHLNGILFTDHLEKERKGQKHL
jgi:peptide deformylase